MAWVCQAVTPTLRPAQEDELIQSENSASIFNTLSDIPSQLEDADLLLAEAMRLAGSLTAVAVEAQRRKHLAYLLADQGQLLGTTATASLSQVGMGGRRPRSPQLPGPSLPGSLLWRDHQFALGTSLPRATLFGCRIDPGLI